MRKRKRKGKGSKENHYNGSNLIFIIHCKGLMITKELARLWYNGVV